MDVYHCHNTDNCTTAGKQGLFEPGTPIPPCPECGEMLYYQCSKDFDPIVVVPQNVLVNAMVRVLGKDIAVTFELLPGAPAKDPDGVGYVLTSEGTWEKGEPEPDTVDGRLTYDYVDRIERELKAAIAEIEQLKRYTPPMPGPISPLIPGPRPWRPDPEGPPLKYWCSTGCPGTVPV